MDALVNALNGSRLLPWLLPRMPWSPQKSYRLLFLLLAGWCLSITALANSTEPVVVLDPASESVNIAPFVLALAPELQAGDAEQAFRFWQQGQFSSAGVQARVTTDLSDTSRWLAFHLRLADPSAAAREWVLSTRDVMHLTQVRLYVPVVLASGPSYRLVRDSLHATGTPPRGSPMSTFLLTPDFDSSRPFLLRVDGLLPMNASLVMQTTQRANWEASIRIALSALLFGSVLGLLLYNFVLYFFVRDLTYLLYVAYAASMVLWLMQISGFMLFLNRDLGLAYYQLITPNLSAGIANVMGSLFTVFFLRLHLQNRWQGLLVMMIALTNVMVGVATYFVTEKATYSILHTSQFFIAGLSSLVVVVPTFVLAIKGYRFALPFIFAWGSLGIGIILLALGVQPHCFDVPFPAGFNVLLAMALEMILMSYALGVRIQDVRQENDQLTELSITDGLTGLYNQRHFHAKVRDLIQTSFGPQPEWACVLIDIDHFKSFNDSYGHLVGDKVLAKLGEIIRSNTRKRDFAFRVGGEEFGLLINTRQLVEALQITERIRTTFATTPIDGGSGQLLNCTLSAGITLLTLQDSSDSFIHRADVALYRAKDAGRNCVQVDSSLDHPADIVAPVEVGA